MKPTKEEIMSKPHILYYADKKGKVEKTLETNYGKATLVAWALYNTRPGRISTIAEKETGLVTDRVIGKRGNFPEVERDLYEQELYLEVESAE